MVSLPLLYISYVFSISIPTSIIRLLWLLIFCLLVILLFKPRNVETWPIAVFEMFCLPLLQVSSNFPHFTTVCDHKLR